MEPFTSEGMMLSGARLLPLAAGNRATVSHATQSHHRDRHHLHGDRDGDCVLLSLHSQILRQRITNAYESTSRLTQQLAYFAENDLPDLSSTPIDTNDPAAVRRALAAYLPMDTNLLNNLESEVALWPFIYDASVVDANGKALLHTNPQLLGKQVAPRPEFYAVTTARSWEQFRLVYRPATVYDVSFPLQLNGAPFGTIHIGVSTVFLKSEITPRLLHAMYFSIASIFASLLLAAGVSNLALGPLKEISRNLDSVSSGATETFLGDESEHDEFGLVTLKIANLGRQMRDSKEIFSALKDNVDQLMSKLQDGLMLFTRDSRVVLVSAPVERFLGRPRGELLGRTAREIFSSDSSAGHACARCFRAQASALAARVRSLPPAGASRFLWILYRKRALKSALF